MRGEKPWGWGAFRWSSLKFKKTKLSPEKIGAVGFSSKELMKNFESQPTQPAPESHGYQTLLAHLRGREIIFASREEELLVCATFTQTTGTFSSYFFIGQNDDYFAAVVEMPTKVPAHTYPAVLELINRINCSQSLGHMELQMESGVLHFGVSTRYPQGHLDDGVIEMMIIGALQSADHFYPPLMRVLYGGETPKDALEENEQQRLLSGENRMPFAG